MLRRFQPELAQAMLARDVGPIVVGLVVPDCRQCGAGNRAAAAVRRRDTFGLAGPKAAPRFIQNAGAGRRLDRTQLPTFGNRNKVRPVPPLRGRGLHLIENEGKWTPSALEIRRTRFASGYHGADLDWLYPG